MERKFPKSPLLHEENQSGCSWGFRSVFEVLFHGHSNQKLISSTTRFNQKKNDIFRDGKAVDHRDTSVSKSTVPFSPPSDRTCWPSMLNDSNTADKVHRSTLKGAFCHYLNLKHVGKSHGCRKIDTVNTNSTLVNPKLGTRHQSKQFLEALEILRSNKELFLKLLEDPCPARKMRFRGFRRYKRIVLSWRRMRSRKRLLKSNQIVILESRTEIERRRSYFPFWRWISKFKKHEKTTSDNVRNRRSNLLRSNEKDLTSPSNPDRKSYVSCITKSIETEGMDNKWKPNEHDHDSEESSLDSQESSPLKTRNTEDSPKILRNLSTHEPGPIHDYVKSLLVAAGMKWDELVTKCQFSDQLLLPTLYQEGKFALGDDSLLLFDYVNEVLLEVYHHHTTKKLGFFLAKENVSHEAMQYVDWDLVLHNRAQTLDQLVQKDLMRPVSWNRDQVGSEDIVAEVVESILEGLIEDIY